MPYELFVMYKLSYVCIEQGNSLPSLHIIYIVCIYVNSHINAESMQCHGHFKLQPNLF